MSATVPALQSGTGVKAEQALLACLAVPHQPDLLEHTQGFGRPRLGRPQLQANSVTGRSPPAV